MINVQTNNNNKKYERFRLLMLYKNCRALLDVTSGWCAVRAVECVGLHAGTEKKNKSTRNRGFLIPA